MDIIIDKAMEAKVKAYLDEFANGDAAFAEKYRDPAKSITDACRLIVKTAFERLKDRHSNTASCMTDEEGFGIAVHYYDEPELTKVEIEEEGKAVTKADTSLIPAKAKAVEPDLFHQPAPAPAPVKKAEPSKKHKGEDTLQLSLW